MSGPDASGTMRAVNLGRPGWTMLISGEVSNGTFELFEELRATESGPPPHVHRELDEAFHVLEGRYAFIRGHEEVRLGPGESIFVPRGTRHAYRTLETPSRTLIVIVPAGLEGFFREMGPRLEAGMTPVEAMAALSATYDSHPVD